MKKNGQLYCRIKNKKIKIYKFKKLKIGENKMKNISKEKTILIFKRNKDNRIYKVIGDFDILTKTFIPIYKKTQSTISKYPEFNRVNIYYKESEDDEYHEFTSETLKQDSKDNQNNQRYWDWKIAHFGGIQTTSIEILEIVLANIIQGNENIEVISMNEEIKEMVDEYKNDAIEIKLEEKDGKIEKIPNIILHNDMYLVYELLLVTGKYIYYAYDDLTLVLDIKDRTLISDNSFACDGLFETLENISNGEEKALYLEKIDDFEY